MTRDEAIEAGARALDPRAWDDALWRLLRFGTAQEVRQADARGDVAAVLDAIGWRPESEVKAEALRQVADAWQMGGWADDLPSKRADRPALIIGMAQRAADYMRARADALGGAK